MTSLDKDLRDKLRGAVQKARQVLTTDLEENLEGVYGIRKTGEIEDLSRLPGIRGRKDEEETRELLVRLLPPAPSSKSEKILFAESFEAVLRSLAFTHLNRLVAFKMMEAPARKFVRETVGRGLNSNGFKYFLADRPDDETLFNSGRQDEAYRHFLLQRSREWNREIGVLFDLDDVASRVFPRPKALHAVLEIINASDLAPVWDHEETLGWVYQYYTPKEIRDKARKESPVPRNSYEMAFRNQFYTPDYVVRFLADNTLGRIWLEMKPDSNIREVCRFLVPRPGDGLGKATRPVKDPRRFRFLDPACGSGHFLLYLFDLLVIIYREAWEDPTLGAVLARDFGDQKAFEAAIPKLIVEENLYGIDIDKRAIQLAALTLLLKAKKLNKDVRIEKSHLVCAEPMPGDRKLLDEFKARKLPVNLGVTGRVLEGIWEKLRLAGDAGSLLKVEEEMSRLVEKERAEWRRRPALFPELLPPEQTELFVDVSGATSWAEIEKRVEALLVEFAEESSGAEGAYRHLFSRDGIEGLRFLEVLGTTFDVVLMNPPFGAASAPSKAYIEETYPMTKNDVFAAFIERWLGRLESRGRLGAITSRTGFFLKSFTRWREEILLPQTKVDVVADLGYGVLDTAMVETAAYVLERRT